MKLVTGWLEGRTVGEPTAPLVQFRFVVYCARLPTLPAAIFSLTVTPMPEERVATAATKGPLPAPEDVAEVILALLLVA